MLLLPRVNPLEVPLLWASMQRARKLGLSRPVTPPSAIRCICTDCLVTYIPLIAIAACGPFIALLLSNPDKVIRRDGVKVQTKKQQNAWAEAKKVFSALGRKEASLPTLNLY